MPLSQGINQTRAHIAGQAMSGALMSARYATGRAQSIQRALVFEVIPNIQQASNDTLARLASTGINNDTIIYMPRNSIVVQLVSGIAIANRKIILFPFFSPHISMPIKPGEYVWAFFEDPTKPDIGFWLSRVHETEHVDDINFTHGDRKFTHDGNPSIPLNAGEKLVGFPNGEDQEARRSFVDPKTFDEIEENAAANKHVRKEPVPRFTKRPGDTVIQGSNNAAIVLGEDRPSNLDSGHTGGSAGTIDMVVGRGLDFTFGNEATKLTSPSIVKTTRGYSEIDKNPRTDNERNINEGDPDFIRDKARVYASMQTDGDDNFSIVKPSNALDANTDAIKSRGYVVHKSDEIRIIARHDGSIHIVKEGENNASIIMHANGTVQIDAEKIQLGRDVGDDKGYVRYSQYKSQMDNLMSLLNEYFTNVQIAFSTNQSPGFGLPNPGVLQAGNHATTALSKITTLTGKLIDARSTKIFGE